MIQQNIPQPQNRGFLDEPPVIIVISALFVLCFPAAVGAIILHRLIKKRNAPFPWPLVGFSGLLGLLMYILLALAPVVRALHHLIAVALLQQQYGYIALDVLPVWLSSILLLPFLLFGFQIMEVRNPDDRLLSSERQRERDLQRRVEKATARLKTMPEVVNGEYVLGVALGGDLQWVRERWATYPEDALGQHGVVLGESRIGKTNTLFRLSYGAKRYYDWDVLFVDGKGDEEASYVFYALMQEAGLRSDEIRVFPALHYNGWRGDPAAIYNRLLAIQDFTEPYYQNIAKVLLHLALYAPGPPVQSSAMLLARLQREELEALYAGRPEQTEVEALSTREIAGVRYRYQAFFASVHGQLDGTWTFEDARASYMMLKGLTLKEEASALGRFLIEDIAHWASERKPRNRRCLIILDDFSTFLEADAANLLERLAVYGASVFVSAQTIEALGDQALRLLGTTTVRLFHRSSDPDRLVARAGTHYEADRTDQIQGSRMTGVGSLRMREVPKIDPNRIRQLGRGQVILVSGGLSQHVLVAPVSLTTQQVEDAGEIIRHHQAAQVAQQPAAPTAQPPSAKGKPTALHASKPKP